MTDCPPNVDNLIQMSNISSAAAIALVLIVFTLWDQIEKIRNKMLLASIMGYTTLMFIAAVACSQAWRHAAKGNFDKFADVMLLTQAGFVAAFSCLVFHSAYRTALILAPASPHTFKIALFAAFNQMCIHIPASIYWGMNIKSTYGSGISPISQKMEVVVLVYYALIESCCFLCTQHRIIQVKGKSQRASSGIKLTLYLKGFLRAVAYSVNVILIFLTLGNRMPENQTLNWQFPLYGPIFILVILLTDSDRFQQCMEKLSGPPTVSSTGMESRKHPTSTQLSRPDAWGSVRHAGISENMESTA